MVRARIALLLLGCFVGLVLISATPAADKAKEKPAEKVVDKDDVQKAVDRGVTYLKQSQQKDGSWGPPYASKVAKVTNTYIGTTALVGLALLESGVPAKDPAVQKAAEFLRDVAADLTYTHALGSCVLFFDRLGDPKDVPIVRTFTARLLAGQARDGGWGYECPKIAPEIVSKWTKPEEFVVGVAKIRELEIATAAPPSTSKLVPGMGVHIRGMTENSCSEFAVQALWIGRRHEIPVTPALVRFEAYCRASQYPDGSFPYSTHLKSAAGTGGVTAGTPCMTCAGLLGLVVCHAAANEQALLKYAKSKDAPKPEVGKGLRDPAKDVALTKAFVALEATMKLSDAAAKADPRVLWGPAGKYTYLTLWAIERVGMAYDVEKIGKIDWYNWGANILLKYQDKDGSWGNGTPAGPVGPDLDTAFALLFLRRCDLTPDVVTIMSKNLLPERRAPSIGEDK